MTFPVLNIPNKSKVCVAMSNKTFDSSRLLFFFMFDPMCVDLHFDYAENV